MIADPQRLLKNLIGPKIDDAPRQHCSSTDKPCGACFDFAVRDRRSRWVELVFLIDVLGEGVPDLGLPAKDIFENPEGQVKAGGMDRVRLDNLKSIPYQDPQRLKSSE
ncbi:hypothetical protein MMC06_002246 [Schaereria dolodes]|nr:hypothetical protein [Schaereria dolodes]